MKNFSVAYFATIFSVFLLIPTSAATAQEDVFCKNTGGQSTTEGIVAKICVATKSDGFAIRGDLVIVVTGRPTRKKWLNVDCTTSFTPSSEFGPVTFKKDFRMSVSTRFPTDRYIIEPQLDRASVDNWKTFSANECHLTVDSEEESLESPSKVGVARRLPSRASSSPEPDVTVKPRKKIRPSGISESSKKCSSNCGSSSGYVDSAK